MIVHNKPVLSKAYDTIFCEASKEWSKSKSFWDIHLKNHWKIKDNLIRRTTIQAQEQIVSKICKELQIPA